jgi:hypothetical protein
MATLAGRPTSAYRPPISRKAATHQLHLGEQWPERPGVAQFLYLSALLHAIAILLFGAPPGGSPDGRAMWGSLNVVIRGPAKDIVIPERMEPIVASPLRSSSANSLRRARSSRRRSSCRRRWSASRRRR